MERLKRAGYLDDRKYIEAFIESRRSRKSQGRFRIAAELQARGLNSQLVREVLDGIYPASDEQESLSRALDKKLRTLPHPLDAKRLARLYNHLRRCGFSSEAIRNILNERFETDRDA
jgi:regulatory protein